jgi:hypothetical protein
VGRGGKNFWTATNKDDCVLTSCVTGGSHGAVFENWLTVFWDVTLRSLVEMYQSIIVPLRNTSLHKVYFFGNLDQTAMVVVSYAYFSIHRVCTECARLMNSNFGAKGFWSSSTFTGVYNKGSSYIRCHQYCVAIVSVRATKCRIGQSYECWDLAVTRVI